MNQPDQNPRALGSRLVHEVPHSRKNHLYAYHGASMSPTLHDAEALEIQPFRKTVPRVGDVIICTPPGHPDYVVHRISRISPQGIFTRGDNARVEDPWMLAPEDIQGRVTSVWAGQKHRRLCGGWMGRLWLQVTRMRWIITRRLAKYLKPLYLRISLSGIVFRLLPPRIQPRVVSFSQKGIMVLRLIWFNTVIGTYHTASGEWQIVIPYHLVVDPALLHQSRSL